MEDNYDLLEDILHGRKDPTNLPLPFLRYITKDFSKEQKIASGGFGEVYKGELKNGTVAVKRLFNEKTMTEELFYQEVDNLMAVKHQNIVRFLGFCANKENIPIKDPNSQGKRYIYAEKRERLLCFEHISNGSLQSHLTDELRGLEWHIRYQIIKNICEGLRYLHDEKNMIHRDLKPDNILLDEIMEAKIADLGISKFLDDGASKAVTTTTWMSQGYCAPEIRQRHEVSFKSDIYSLGVIIIELITGRKRDPEAKHVLRRWRYRWNKTEETTLSCQQVLKCIDIGLQCRNEDPKKRPSISEIIRELNEISSADGQIIPFFNDVLWIEPLELFFPFEINKEVSCSLQLTNKTNSYIAFNIHTTSLFQYWKIQPKRGIVPPVSTCRVEITFQGQDKAPQDMRHDDQYIVKGIKVNEGLTVHDITEDIFTIKGAHIVDEVRLDVVFDEQLRAPCVLEDRNEDFSLGGLGVSGPGLYESEAFDVPQVTAHTGLGETNPEKISSCRQKKLIQVHPQEMRFPLLPSERLTASSGIKIVNITDEHVAFVVRDSPLNNGEYITHPETGVMLPWSTQELVVKRTAKKAVPHRTQCNDKYYVHATAVSKGFKNVDIGKFYETQTQMGQIWHTMELGVTLEEESQLQAPDGTPQTECSGASKILIEVHDSELRFPCLTNERLSPSSAVKIVNLTDNYVALAPRSSPHNVALYFHYPKGVVMPPRSTQELVVTRTAKKGVPQGIQCDDKWYIYSTVVGEDFKSSDHRKFYETKTGQIWHNVELGVVLEAALQLQGLDHSQHAEKIPSLTPKKLIHVHPHELRFPFLRKDNISVSAGIKLANITDDYIAFCMKSIIYNVAIYNFYPQEGIIPPRSTQEVVVKRAVKAAIPRNLVCNDVCYVYSFTVTDYMKNNNENKFYRQQAGEIWHNTELAIVLEETSQLKSSKSIMDLSLANKQIRGNQLMGQQTLFKPMTRQSVSSHDQMIEADPTELILPLEPRKVEFLLKILNITDDHVAYRVRYTISMAKLYDQRPNSIGILSPRSMISFKNTRSSSPEGAHEDMKDTEIIYLASTIMSKGFKMADITNDLFDKPAAGRIVHTLKVPVFLVESSGPLSWEGIRCANQSMSLTDKQGDQKANYSNCQVISSDCSYELIVVDPLPLFLPMETRKVEFSLKILNVTDYYVAYRIRYTVAVAKLYGARPNSSGILPPRSMLTFINTRLPSEWTHVVMQETELLYLATTIVNKDFKICDITHDLFDKSEPGRLLHTLKLPVYFVAPSAPQSLAINSSSAPTDQNKSGFTWVNSIDVHPSMPWIIMTQQDLYVCIWNYHTQEVKRFFLGFAASQVTSVKFIAEQQQIVAGTSHGLIYLLSYEALELISFVRAHSRSVNSLAIHATEPYVLSASFSGDIQLRDYEDDMGLIKTFDTKIWCARSVAFDPSGATFASACGVLIKTWNLDSGECKHTFCGHSHEVTCLEYFTREDELYLISGSQDRTAKIWDCHTGRCVRTLKVYSPVRAVCSHPDLQILITGSYNGSVHIWNSTSFRHERVLKLDLGCVNAIAYLKGSTRVAIGHACGIELAEIGPEEAIEC